MSPVLIKDIDIKHVLSGIENTEYKEYKRYYKLKTFLVCQVSWFQALIEIKVSVRIDNSG